MGQEINEKRPSRWEFLSKQQQHGFALQEDTVLLPVEGEKTADSFRFADGSLNQDDAFCFGLFPSRG
jgi:hypothetical protein